MIHIESSIKIYYTKDYSIFKNIVGNRLLNEGKIKRIIADIEDGLDMLRYYPILVDKNMRVIDGQHRLYVAKTIKSNVWYIVIHDEMELHEIAKVNSNVEKWSKKDFINCYSMQGNKNYETLQQFLTQYGFPVSVAVQLLAKGKMHDGGATELIKIQFERGEFVVKHLDKATALAQKVEQFNEFKARKSGGFIDAIDKILLAQKCDFNILVEKYQKRPDALKVQPATKQYILNLEEIYNHQSKVRRIIF